VVECGTCAVAASVLWPHSLAPLAGALCTPLDVLGANAVGVAPGGDASTGCALSAAPGAADTRARWCAYDSTGHMCALQPRHLDGCLLRVRAPTEDVDTSAARWAQAVPWRGPLELLHWQVDASGPPCASALCSHLQLTYGVAVDAAAYAGALQRELALGADTYPSVLTATDTCANRGGVEAAVLVQIEPELMPAARRLSENTTASPPPASALTEVTLGVTVLLRDAGEQWSEVRLTLSKGTSASAADAQPGDVSVNLQVADGTVTVVPLGAALPGNGSVFHMRVVGADAATATASLLRADVADADGVQWPTTLANFAAAPPPPDQRPPPPPPATTTTPQAPPPIGPPLAPVAAETSVTSLLLTIGTGTAVVVALLELLSALRNRCSEESTGGICAPVGKLIRALLDSAISLLSNIANPIG
jgi:hypothetical protein